MREGRRDGLREGGREGEKWMREALTTPIPIRARGKTLVLPTLIKSIRALQVDGLDVLALFHDLVASKQ